MTDFLFLGSKITVDGDCSHEIRRLLLGRKVMTNLDNMLKSKDHGIWSHHLMANREKMETVTDFIFLGSKITADDD